MKSSVTAVIFADDHSSVLVLKRRDVPLWVLPGGSIDDGETPEEAVIREALEETGLEVSITRKVALYTPINRLTTVTHLFECEVSGGSLQTGSETKDLDFFPLKGMPLNTFHVHSDMIDDALLNRSEVIHKPLIQVTYWKLLTYFLRHPIQVLRFFLSQIGFPINT